MKYDLDFFRGNAWDPFRLLQTREDKWIPACDVEENENRYLVTVDLPGVPKDNVKVEFHDGALVISGRETQRAEGSPRHATPRRANCRHVPAVVHAPGGNRTARIQAAFDNGVLPGYRAESG